MIRALLTSKRRLEAFHAEQRAERDATFVGKTRADGAVRGRSTVAAWALLRPHRRALALIVLLGLSSIAVDVSWPLASRYLVDSVILTPGLALSFRLRRLALVSGSIAALFVLNALFDLWRSFRTQLLEMRVSSALRGRLFHRVLRLPMTHIGELKTGGILSRLSSDVDDAAGLLRTALLGPALSFVRLALTLGIVFALDWRIATAILFALPPIVIAQNLWLCQSRTIWKSMGDDRSEIQARVSEGLNGLRVVRGFARERSEERSFVLGQHTVVRKHSLATGTQRMVALVWDLVMPLTQVTILGFGGYLVLRGQTTVGTLLAFQGYLWRLIDPMTELVKSLSETQRGFAALERVSDVLERPEEKPDRPQAIEAPARVREIQLSKVGFGYKRGAPVIRDFELRVPGGSVVALVGASGAGKTTIVDLIARFHDPTSGAIRLNGVDLRDIRLRSYRRLLGIVQQDVFLFDGSVRDNIAYGRNEATDREIEAAARSANAHEFILALPEGYQTMVGERGVKLSGGQRQRLSIARAILADPQILILDEATSSLDGESERLIQASMQRLFAERTTFIIAHRLSTITRADMIVVLDHGRIVEVGRHEALLGRRGVYAKMFDAQRKNIERRSAPRREAPHESRADAE